ncbi:PDR/VanB family oxidoreductase [Bordetella trematum]|uniref:PDR/VanB family oxidoreductase n=1 Tax=Bordetella trematum TaxID=123899 RepID=UPI001A9CAAF7|nr:PDR/VanB family oxidoreductase [Bordetella trematum]
MATSPTPLPATTLPARIHSIALEAEGIYLLDIRPAQQQRFPAVAPGAHIDLHLPNGLTRSYSTINAPGEEDRYLVAVKHEAGGRGGSHFIHAELRVGQTLAIGGPRNHFGLREDARHSVLIAGGIGITPIYSMVRRLEHLNQSWELHYAAADPAHAAFGQALQALQPRVRFYFNASQSAGAPLDLRQLIADSRDDADFYCCGPQSMLADFQQFTSHLPPERVHAEYFGAVQAPAVEGGYEIILQRSQQRATVAPGATILDTVMKLGVDVPYSCMEGVCGSCEVRVLQGTPDHRDLILSKAEREQNDRMMICCSGAKSSTLVLDL